MPINTSAINLLDQLAMVIQNMTDETFRKKISTLSNSSIGQHVRHTLEFFICLMDANTDGVINYDNRKHDTYIEEETSLALSVINSIKSFLNDTDLEGELELQACYEVDGSHIETIKSNFKRELSYNIEHAIHHMALIKIGVKELLPDFVFPAHFGVASSTVRHQQNLK